MKNSILRRSAALRGTRNLAIQKLTISTSAFRAPCTSSTISHFAKVYP
jgi:hypothetical protein